MWIDIAVSFATFFWMSRAAKIANREFKDHPSLPVNWGPNLEPNRFARRAMALALFPHIALVTMLAVGLALGWMGDASAADAAGFVTLFNAGVFVLIQWGYHVAVRRYLQQ